MAEYKVKKVISSKSIPKKDGSGSFPKSQVLSENDDVFSVMGNPKVGDILRGEIVDKGYGPELQREAFQKSSFAKNSFNSDPDTMLIAYAKDVVVALIDAKVVKDAQEAADKVRSFTTLFLGLYKKSKAGKSILPKVEVEEPEEGSIDKSAATPDESEDEEINMDDIPF